MAAYVIAEIEVTDPATYEEYKKKSSLALAAHGGRFIVRGGAAEALEGEGVSGRMVVLEFESLADAKRWWASKEYASARVIRQRSARTRMIAGEGV